MKTVTYDCNGTQLSFETGRMAKQADGSVVVRMGDTVVLVTAVCSRRPTDRDFLPLFVEYREKLYAAGRIPGGCCTTFSTRWSGTTTSTFTFGRKSTTYSAPR